MIGNHIKKDPAFNFSKSIDRVCSSKLNLMVTKCLSLWEHGSCSGLYSDTIGFGFQVRCVCKCHNKEDKKLDEQVT